MKRKVCLFDFDNTVARGDTIHRILLYDIKKHPFHVFHFIKTGILFVAYKCKLCTFETTKNALLFPIKYMDDKEMETFYNNIVKPTYYPNVVEEMKQKRQDGYYIVLCTASSECYMKYTDLPIDHLIGTVLERQNGRYINKIIGKNCKGKHKVPRILDHLKEKDIEIDYENSYGYSDSNSDIPMLDLVKNQVRVELKTGKMKPFIK